MEKRARTRWPHSLRAIFVRRSQGCFLVNRTPIICIEERTMKKSVKRTKAKSSATRARTKSKPKRTTRTKTAKATKKSILPKVKRVAKKAALAAGVAAIGTALSELQPETKVGEQDASHDDKSNRGKTSEG
jgi:hypothetical protein